MKKYLTIFLVLTFIFVFKVFSQQQKQTKKKSNKENMILIPAGEFTMGSNDYDEEKPPHKVYLDAYYIDKYEVTNAKYKDCGSVGICKKPKDTKYYNDSSYANHPVVYVDWYMADAYCKWAGKNYPQKHNGKNPREEQRV